LRISKLAENLVSLRPIDTSKIGSKTRSSSPFAASKLRTRVARYNECVALAKEYEAQGRALIIAPDDICGLDTLKRDREALIRFYQKGYQEAKRISAFLGANPLPSA